MNPYTLDYSEYKNDILDVLVEVYGYEFESVIRSCFNLIYSVLYVNYEGLNSYYRFLLSCKSRELSLKMLKIIGVDVDKYRVTNYADEFCEELRDKKYDDELVIDYHKQMRRLREVYRRMDATYEERTDYYKGYGYRKRKIIDR